MNYIVSNTITAHIIEELKLEPITTTCHTPRHNISEKNLNKILNFAVDMANAGVKIGSYNSKTAKWAKKYCKKLTVEKQPRYWRG